MDGVFGTYTALLAVGGAAVVVQLRARAGGAGDAHRPEVVLLAAAHDPRRRHTDLLPQLDRLVVVGPRAEVPRAALATVTGFDRHGAPVTVTGSGYFARCLQHECDHLDGTVYVDRLPAERCSQLLREAGLKG